MERFNNSNANTSQSSRTFMGLLLAAAFTFSCTYSFNSQANTNAINYDNCQNCHANEQQQWQRSDHFKAMTPMNETTVLGDFNNAKASHYSLSANFYRKDQQYWVSLSQDQGQSHTAYPIAYTFGHFPLQQYLVKTEQGKMQVLPFSWDSRPADEGGQQWFHIYTDNIKANDRLHWLQPMQNWNGMCADCHSQGFKRHYQAPTDIFNSDWQAINVDCKSCHQDYNQPHGDQGQENHNPIGAWHKTDTATAKWVGQARNTDFMWNCFSCHGLRSPLTDGFKAGEHFLNQFTPSFLNAPMYHADGQIKEEVYVMGSFLQSKMYQMGVTCLDCHNPHTGKVKVEGNGLCLQCHTNDTFNQTKHHGHQATSSGAQCVNCHMPTTTYMGVDSRRDHSFSIPDANMSKTFGTPLACLSCHQQQDHRWAKQTLSNWHGDNFKPEKWAYASLLSGQSNDGQQLLALLRSDDLATIKKASLIKQLPFLTRQLPGQILAPLLRHESALIRIAAAQVSNLMSEADRITYLAPILTDKYRSVRVAAVTNLLDVQLPSKYAFPFARAFKELGVAQNVSAWRGEGRANIASSQLVQGKVTDAIVSLENAIAIDPYFDGGYINLASIYQSLGKQNKEAEVYELGLKQAANSGSLNYSYALFLIRRGQYKAAVKALERARNLEPNNEQYVYTHVLSMEKVASKVAARKALQDALQQLPESRLLQSLTGHL